MGKIIDFPKMGCTFRNKSNDTLEIILYGAIGQSFFEDSISAAQFSKQLEQAKDVKNIVVRINSVGGDVFDGITIYNRLKQHKARVTVYVDALAASIASIIMLAGDEIILGEGSQIMIHKPWTFAAGNSNDLEAIIDRLDDIEEQMITIYQKKTGLDRNEIKTMLAKETWLDADEAIKLGFADKTFENEYQMVASADVPWIKRLPKIENKAKKTINEKITNMQKSIEGLLKDRK